MGDRVGYPTVLRDRPCDIAFAGCCIMRRSLLLRGDSVTHTTSLSTPVPSDIAPPPLPSPPPGGSLRARPVSPGGGAGRRMCAVQLGGGPPRCRAPRRRADRDAQPVRLFYVHVFRTGAVCSLHPTVPCVGMRSFTLPGLWNVECRPRKWLRCGWLPYRRVLCHSVALRQMV